MRIISSLVLFLFFGCVGVSAQIADHLPGCLPDPVFDGKACDASAHEFGIVGGQIVAQNVDGEDAFAGCCNGPGGNNLGNFVYAPIDISSYEDIMISFDYSASNTDFEDEFPAGPSFGCLNAFADNSHDQIVFTYTIDGGAEVQSLYVHGETQADFTGTWIEGPLNGQSLLIRVYCANKAQAEIFYFDNLVISGTPLPISAGQNVDVCNNTAVQLSATGAGMWSGGTGSFDDILDPNATYTPGGGDDNSTVTLTYTALPASPSCAGAYPPPSATVDLTFGAPTATIAYSDPSFTGQFCSGDCQTIDVNISGGVPLYTLNLELVIGPLPIPIPFPIPGFDLTDNIIVCYDPSETVPGFDPATNTITVPASGNGLGGTLTLTEITDDTGCSTSLNEQITMSFQTTPELDPAILQECADASGFASFNVFDADPQVDPSFTYTVEYFQAANMTGAIVGSSYITSGETVYAFATDNGCTSDPAPVTLVALPEGDVGTVELSCSPTMVETSCLTICDQGGDGELVDVYIAIGNPGDYTVEFLLVPGGTQFHTFNGTTSTYEVFVTGPTSIEIISVTDGALCPDLTDLGQVVTLDVITPPILNNPGNQVACNGSYELPDITGSNLSGSQSYYSGTNGSGTSIPVGTVITADTTIYIYDGVPGCDDEVSLMISVGGGTTYDEPSDVVTCGSYTLPAITGTGVGATTAYYTGPGGTGMSFVPGDVLVMDVPALYIFDPASTCATNEPSFSVMISAGDTLLNIMDTILCGLWEAPVITSSGPLSGNEAYYTAAGGDGIGIAIGDTVTIDSLLTWVDTSSIILYAYDSLAGCVSQESFRLTIAEPAYAGRDTMISYCNTLGVSIDLMGLAANPQEGGLWTATTPLVNLTDSTAVNLGALVPGSYSFMYGIMDTVCGDMSSTISVDVADGAFAGLDGSFIFCENELPTDLFLLAAATDITGTWSTVPDVGFDFSNPSFATFSGLSASTFDILYIVEDVASGCPADTATLAIIVTQIPDAGSDTTVNVCQGSSVNLASLVTGAVTGTFNEVAPGTGLTGSIVNTSALNGVYGYQYIEMNTCGIDTATIVLSVSTTADAGDDLSVEVCDSNQELALSSLVTNGDPGGQFYIGGVLVSDVIRPIDFSPPIVVSYIVGDGVTCDFDTAMYDLTLVDFDISVAWSSIPICTGNARLIRVDYSSDRDFQVYFSVTNTATGISTTFDRYLDATQDDLTFQLRNTVDGIEDGINLEPGQRYTVQLDSVVALNGDCVILFDDFWFIQTVDVQLLDTVTTICRGDSIFVADRWFKETFRDTVSTAIGCDSITNIEINFLRRDTMVIDGQRCAGTQVDIDGEIFDENNPSGQVDLTNAVGCDSTIIVDLTFIDINEVIVDTALCGNASIVVGGMVFDQNNPSGMFTNPGVGGDCDTLFMVDVEIGATVTTLVDDVLCDGASLMVGTEVFDESNPTGSVMLLTTSGCDSIVDVDLTFSDATQILIDDVICPGDTITVNGADYFTGASDGEIMLDGVGGDCDTVVTVDLVEVSPTTSNLELFSCAPDSVFVIGGSTVSISNPTLTFVAGQNTVGCDSIVEVEAIYGSLGVSINQQDIATGTQLSVVTTAMVDQVAWTPASGLSCTDCLDPIATPLMTTTYMVTITAGDCEETAEVTVRVIEDNTITFPNIINPDGNPANNTFYIKGPSDQELVVQRMLIYDRWGNLVFETSDNPINDPAYGWDGLHKGEPVSQGVYVYYVELVSLADQSLSFARSGDLTIIR